MGEFRMICPHCSSSRRKQRDACLAVNVDKGTWYCWHCGWKGGLYGRWHADSVRPKRWPSTPAKPDYQKRAALDRVWCHSRPIGANDPVHNYLRQRGLELGPVTNVPKVLKYHPHLTYLYTSGERTQHPAMLAAVHNPAGLLVSIHRTYLTHNGFKADVSTVKKLMSPISPGATRGAAIRLHKVATTLAVAEGIETALAVHIQTGLPVWASISATGMKALVLPDVVKDVMIFADHDRSGVGYDAATTLAQRMRIERRRVKIFMPEIPGTDWADAMEKQYDIIPRS